MIAAVKGVYRDSDKNEYKASFPRQKWSQYYYFKAVLHASNKVRGGGKGRKVAEICRINSNSISEGLSSVCSFTFESREQRSSRKPLDNSAKLRKSRIRLTVLRNERGSNEKEIGQWLTLIRLAEI